MKAQNVDHMFNFVFEKSSSEITAAALAKVGRIKAKINEREQRIVSTMQAERITDKGLNEILLKARAANQRNEHLHSYSFSNSAAAAVDGANAADVAEITVGAGTVNMLLTEMDHIEGEKSQVARLQVIIRNLKDLPDARGVERGHRMTYDELRFLDF